MSEKVKNVRGKEVEKGEGRKEGRKEGRREDRRGGRRKDMTPLKVDKAVEDKIYYRETLKSRHSEKRSS